MSATAEWVLLHNSNVAVADGDSERKLRQTKGFPIGGHLSASLVELVAVFREHTADPWPSTLAQYPSCRCCDNFFVAVDTPIACPLNVTAQDLTELSRMPVKAVARGPTARFLEVRLTLTRGSKVRSLLAFRTDPDRQGRGGGGRAMWTPGPHPMTLGYGCCCLAYWRAWPENCISTPLPACTDTRQLSERCTHLLPASITPQPGGFVHLLFTL